MGVVMPVIMGAIFLGKAFDMKTMSETHIYIFDKDVINENKEEIPKSYTTSFYKLIDKSSDVTDIIDVEGDIALKVMSGKLDISGGGKYLKRVIDRTKTVEILLSVYHETVTETFPSFIPTRVEWMRHPKESVGTHYIRSITYGGRLIISYQMITNSSEDTQLIKAVITSASLQLGGFGVTGSGNFSKLTKDISDKYKIEITTFSTTSVVSPPSSLEDAYQLMEDYPAMIRQVNEGKGVPMKMELIPLTTLKSDAEVYVRNTALNSVLEDAINKFEDINNGLKIYKTWNKGWMHPFTDEQHEVSQEFYGTCIRAKNAMNAAILTLDASKVGKADHFDAAFDAYGAGGDNVPNRFTRWARRVINIITNTFEPFYTLTYATTQYIRWGSSVCTPPNIEPIYAGHAMRTHREWWHGNGGDYICLPDENVNLKSEDSAAPLRIGHLKHKTLDTTENDLVCASCLLTNASRVFTVPGQFECPEKMKREYAGFIMSENAAPICVDRHSMKPAENATEKSFGTLVPVIKIGRKQKKQYIPCAVCSR